MADIKNNIYLGQVKFSYLLFPPLCDPPNSRYCY